MYLQSDHRRANALFHGTDLLRAVLPYITLHHLNLEVRLRSADLHILEALCCDCKIIVPA